MAVVLGADRALILSGRKLQNTNCTVPFSAAVTRHKQQTSGRLRTTNNTLVKRIFKFVPPVSVSFHQSCPSFDNLRGRRSKGKGKGIRARDHARGRREEGNACKEAIVFAIPPTPVSLPPSSRAPRVSLASKTPFSFPFKRLPRRLKF